LIARTLSKLRIETKGKDEAIAEADTLLLTISNQLGVTYNAHIMEAILTSGSQPSENHAIFLENFSDELRGRVPLEKT
jgi:hypothetical protein